MNRVDNKEAKKTLSDICKAYRNFSTEEIRALELAIKALEQQHCEMTAEEYRQRMIQAFHNAGTGELIAVCVLPTEKEFEHLEWLLKNHYKKEPCEDAISRADIIKRLEDVIRLGIPNKYGKHDMTAEGLLRAFKAMPPVSVAEKTGRWIFKEDNTSFVKSIPRTWAECDCCHYSCSPGIIKRHEYKYCPNCGAKMGVEE